MNDDVLKDARASFPPATAGITLGAIVHGGECAPEPIATLPLAMANRHGLVAGATGTGKTKTVQLMAEQFSAAGVPVFVADLKGDLSGLAAPGVPDERIARRAKDTGWGWSPAPRPVEFLSLTGARGAQLRATVSSFGPLLLARVLGLNDTQTSVLTMVFKFADDQKLPLLDFQDLRAVLHYLSSDAGEASLATYGGMAGSTVGVLFREMVELEQQGAGAFLGVPEFELQDLLRLAPDGSGIVSVLELQDVQDRPAMFSTFMMWMLARLYNELPEVGDLPKPRLVFFFDEAHLLFEGASRAFLEQVEQVVRLVRSKGVGVYFVTQNPKDVPADILGQLGNRVQHALRAHTPDDEKALRAAARTFPRTPHYAIEETLTTLGTGEALVTVLRPDGSPTPSFAVRMIPPATRMAPLAEDELRRALALSEQVREYAAAEDPLSARELLLERMAPAAAAPAGPGGATSAPGPPVVAGGMLAALGAALNSPLGRMIAGRATTQVARGVMGALLGPATRRRTRRRLF